MFAAWPLLAALALGAQPARSASPADSLRLGANGRDLLVITRADASGQYVNADVAAPALGGRMQRLPNHRFLLTVGGVVFELADRSAFALSDGRVFPMTSPSLERDGHLDVPLQLLTDIAPRAGARLAWEPARRRLVLATSAAELADNRPVQPTPTAPRVTATAGGLVIGPSTKTRPDLRPDAPSVASSPRAGTSGPRGNRRHVIIVDAGHGGVDPGMRGWSPDRTPVREKDVTLGVARRLEQELNNRGYDVVMTRTTDTLIALDDRGRIANRSKGDLFISVHVNAANPNWRDPHAARGFETYFLAEAKTEDERRVARMENEVVRFENETNAPKNDPLGFIINDMAQNEHLRESNDLAAGIQDALHRVHPGPSRGVKQAGFRVLVTAYMPAVLVEIGFGTNASEAAFISSDAGQRTLATAIADAAAEYLARYEQRVGNGR
jgi:N-acetylmuramoyl-L-alanine amidase